jgi:hypothetical protein
MTTSITNRERRVPCNGHSDRPMRPGGSGSESRDTEERHGRVLAADDGVSKPVRSERQCTVAPGRSSRKLRFRVEAVTLPRNIACHKCDSAERTKDVVESDEPRSAEQLAFAQPLPRHGGNVGDHNTGERRSRNRSGACVRGSVGHRHLREGSGAASDGGVIAIAHKRASAVRRDPGVIRRVVWSVRAGVITLSQPGSARESSESSVTGSSTSPSMSTSPTGTGPRPHGLHLNPVPLGTTGSASRTWSASDGARHSPPAVRRP